MANEYKIKLNSAEEQPYIERVYLRTCKVLLKKLNEKTGAEYSNQTKMKLLNLHTQFAQQIDEILASENVNPESNLFDSPVNYNYFEQ